MRLVALLLLGAAACKSGGDSCAPPISKTILYEQYCDTTISTSGICLGIVETGF